MKAVGTLLELIGSMGFLLYGMKLMSNGIQKSTGEKLQRALNLMTGNRFVALLTGMTITMIIQSSGATTVMVVSFVNAGMLTLRQSVGVIFGANIGTTVTAWIVTLFGFSFDIKAFAVPLFGIGFALTAFSRLHKQNLGEAIMGFGLLFVGLGMLSSSFSPTSPVFQSLSYVQGHGAVSLFLGLIIGLVITALLHSSSAMSAIVLTLAYNGLVTWEFSASMVIGSNIGSTIDAIMAAIGTRADAKRACLIHVMFNVAGAILSLIFFAPLLNLVDNIVPGDVMSNITLNISVLHTLIKIATTVVLIPFANHIADLSCKLIKSKDDETPLSYHLEYTETSKENVAVLILQAEKEIEKLTDVATTMFDKIQIGFKDRSPKFVEENLISLEQFEKYADQMQEELAKFLVHAGHLPANENQTHNISLMLQIVDELELMTDDCFSVGLLIAKSIEKQMEFPQEDMDRLIPYVELARQFLQFIRININKHLDVGKLEMAHELEEQIDLFRKNLKKVARKRLESGADVKAELLYIDLVRNIEKIGDCAFAISEALSQTR